MLRSRMTRLLPILATFLLLGVPAPMTAQESSGQTVLQLDPDSSKITFTLGATLHTVEGSFNVSRGVIRFDPESGEASGEIVANVASGDTGKKGRDEDMHAKVLESEQYPRAVLTPTRVEGSLPESGSGEVTLHGTLELHGSTHEVSIPTQVTGGSGGGHRLVPSSLRGLGNEGPEHLLPTGRQARRRHRRSGRDGCRLNAV